MNEINEHNKRESENQHDMTPMLVAIIIAMIQLFLCFKQFLLSRTLKQKKALSLTVIFFLLFLFLGNLNILFIGRISENSWNLVEDYLLFFLMSLPAIYCLFLNLNFHKNNSKFRASVAWIVGMLVFRANNHRSWSLSDDKNFISCLMISTLFSIIILGLSYYTRDNYDSNNS